MNSFVLSILFTGLMAFVPNENGTEVTVLLLKSDHYHTSDGSAMPAHKSLLFARAGNCTGSCVTNDTNIASFTYKDQASSAALDSLAYALGNGSAWVISGSDITVQNTAGGANLPALNVIDDVRGTANGHPNVIPTTSTERRDFSWIPSLTQLCASGCAIRTDLLNTIPPDLIAARFKISSGDLYTYSVARLGSDVTPVHFKRLDGDGSASSYTQAITSWTGVNIEVTGDSVQFVETRYDGGTGRTMTLSPDASNKIEVAVVNLPPFVPPASTTNAAPQVGKHFEMYYELLQNPPAREARLVPRVGAPGNVSVPQVTWSSVHPSTAVDSVLLTRLRLDTARSLYDRIICPPTKLP